jgi:uncharacterized protein YkwD
MLHSPLGRNRLRALVALSVACALAFGLAGAGDHASAGERSGRRRMMLALTNHDRERADRAELDFAGRLSRYAKRHSEAMARRGAIFHSSEDEIRALMDGYEWSLAGGNVGVGTSLEGLQEAFMDSKLHRQNILRPVFEQAAIGIARVDGHLWVTVIFYG